MMSVRDPLDVAIEASLLAAELGTSSGDSDRRVAGSRVQTFTVRAPPGEAERRALRASVLIDRIMADVWASTVDDDLAELLRVGSRQMYTDVHRAWLDQRHEDTKAMAEMAEKQLRAHHQFVSNMRAHAREARADKPRKAR